MHDFTFFRRFSENLTHPEIDFYSANKRPGRLFGTKIQINAPPPGAFNWGGGVYSENSGIAEQQQKLRFLPKTTVFSFYPLE